MLQILSSLEGRGPPKAKYPKSICSLDAMFRQERAGLVRYLTKRVGPEFANDLVQDIFLRAATSPQLSTLSNPRAFLHRIARNLLVDRARRQRCKIVTVTTDDPIESQCPPAQEYQLEADELEAAFALALGGLPERTRAIFLMHRFDDLAYREIQQELGISMAGVEYHMMKALAHVRACLRDHAAIPESGSIRRIQK